MHGPAHERPTMDTAEILARADDVAAAAAAAAVSVDKEGRFPSESIDALRNAGLFGLGSAPEVGGLGGSPGVIARVIERLARECGSTAMVTCMHYAGTAVIEAHGDEATRRAIAEGRHLSTLAFSESGSRSHFWAPTSTAKADGQGYVLDARKSWVTSAHHADGYVWSSGTVSGAEGPSTIWLVPRTAEGVDIQGSYVGLGLRGNDSTPVVATGVKVPAGAMLGDDGAGFDIMMGVVLPRFNLWNASCSVGLMKGAVQRAATHCSGQRYEHIDTALADLPTIRAYLARAQIKTDMAAALITEAAAAIEGGREDAMLRVLEVKAGAAETALEVVALCMRVCGGAAYRADVGVERYSRDAQAANIMAPTTDVLYDFIGKAITGLPLF